jgi:hypothetical protein
VLWVLGFFLARIGDIVHILLVQRGRSLPVVRP